MSRNGKGSRSRGTAPGTEPLLLSLPPLCIPAPQDRPGPRVPQGCDGRGSHRSRNYRGEPSWALSACSEHWHCSTRCFPLGSQVWG
ncbi:hypothetical protein Nmel_011950 [Mimus melanotis]